MPDKIGYPVKLNYRLNRITVNLNYRLQLNIYTMNIYSDIYSLYIYYGSIYVYPIPYLGHIYTKRMVIYLNWNLTGLLYLLILVTLFCV